MNRHIAALVVLVAAGTVSAQITAIHSAFGDDPQSQAVVSWQGGASGALQYGPTTSYGESATAALVGGSYHASLSGLTPGTEYHFECAGDASAVGTFKTAPASGETFTFAVTGDVQGDDVVTQRWTDLANFWAGRDVAFWLPVGDLVDQGQEPSHWTAFWGGCDALASTKPCVAVRGNHELYGPGGISGHECNGLFLEQFPVPANGGNMYYWVEYGDALLIILDTFCPDRTAMRDWTEQVLINNTKQWVFVFLHLPIYCTGGHGGADLEPDLNALWEQYEVNAVFSGHSHSMSVNYPIDDGAIAPSYADGVLYFNTAGVNYNSARDDVVEAKPFQSYLQPESYLPMATEVTVRTDSTIVTTYNHTDLSVYNRVALPPRRVAGPGVLAFSQGAVMFDEDAGTVSLEVRRWSGSQGTVTVQYTTASDQAVAGEDFDSTGGTLTFGDGQTVDTIEVALTDDQDIENHEAFVVRLSTPGGGATLGAQDSTVVTIADDDSPGSLALATAVSTVMENQTLTIDVLRSGGTAGTATVVYATADGSAEAGTDYVAVADTLTFADGDSIETITVDITDDTDEESVETFTITLSSPSGATLGSPAAAEVTITDNDGAQGTLDIALAQAGDEAEETVSSGAVQLGSDTRIEIGNKNGTTNQIVAWHFPSVTIPNGSSIDAAYIQFHSDGASAGDLNLTIYAEASADAPAFTGVNSELSDKVSTVATVSWSPAVWSGVEAGVDQRTSDLRSIMQELVDQAGWVSGSAVTILISAEVGTEQRNVYPTASSFEDFGDNRYSPVLHIDYGGVTRAPSVATWSPSTPLKVGVEGGTLVWMEGVLEAELVVIDLHGRRRFSARMLPGVSASLPALPRGTYLMRCTGGARSTTRRLVVSR